jgi:hypothetical protein
MRTTYETVGPSTYFLLVDLPPMYHQAALDLQFEQTTDGFANSIPPTRLSWHRSIPILRAASRR